MKISRGELTTEQQNLLSHNIDKLSTVKILELINQEDHSIPSAVKKVIPEIKSATNIVVNGITQGNKVFYLGAGTSGRLGILDASEIPPTFSAPTDWFTGVIAGGRDAAFRSIEGAEDISKNAIIDLKNFGISEGDIIIGIASSSTTPYVIAGLEYGKSVGSTTIFLVFNPIEKNLEKYDVIISVNVGPELITGSTRMKAGTATKLILNMISTTAMIKMGKVYGNLMVDLQVVNDKLRDRGTRIIQQLTNLNYEKAGIALKKANGSVKIALVMIIRSLSKREAINVLNESNGNLRNIIGDALI